MFITDVLAHAATGNALWDFSAVNAQNRTPSADGASSFRSLLEERQSLSGNRSENSYTEAPADTSTSSPTHQPDSEETPETHVNMLVVGATMFAQGIPQMVQPPEPAAEELDTELLSVLSATVGEQPPTASISTPEQSLELPAIENTVAPELSQSAQSMNFSSDTDAKVPSTASPQSALASDAEIPALPNSPFLSDEGQGAENDLASTLPQHERTKQPDSTTAVPGGALFPEPEHIPVKVGDAATVDVTAPASEVEQSLGDIMTHTLDSGSQRVEIQLSPESLGKVTVEFTRSPEGSLQVVLRAETEHAAKILSEHTGALSLILQDNNYRDVRVDVMQPQQSEQPWQQPDDQNSQQQQQRQQPQQQQSSSPQETESFLHQLRLGLTLTPTTI